MDKYIIYQSDTANAPDELEFCQKYVELNRGEIVQIYHDDQYLTQLKRLIREINENTLGRVHDFLSYSRMRIPTEQDIQHILHSLFLSKNMHITYLQQNLSSRNSSGQLAFLSEYYGKLYDQGHLNYFEFVGSVSQQATKIYNTVTKNKYCECSICGWKGMRFNPAYYKDGFVENIICVNCDSWGRHRRAWGLLHDGGYLKENMKILDTAPMKMLSQKIQQCHVHYTSIDIETDRSPTIQGDLTKIPFKENSFDLVLSMQVLEHIMDDKTALRNLIAVTKDTGTLIISVPFKKTPGSVTREYGAPNWEEFGHVREYGMDVVERFQNEGLHIEEFVWGQDKNKLALLQLGIDPTEKEVFFICKKLSSGKAIHEGPRKTTFPAYSNQHVTESHHLTYAGQNGDFSSSAHKPQKIFTVIIPTYNRIETLQKTLRAYNNQTVSPDVFEVLIIDDGSTDRTQEVISRLRNELHYTLHYHHQTNQGPGKARNWGIKNTTTEYIFLTGDDIIPDQNMIWEHCKSHISDPREDLAVLGHIDWPPEMPMNPLMYFLTKYTGMQFGFNQIQDPENAGFEFFYTSNISLKTSFLKQNELFNPKFVHAAYEDIELGYRLQNQGMKIKYNKRALGNHDHAMTFDSVCRRQHKCGQMAVVLCQLHPELQVIVGNIDLTYNETQHRQLSQQIEELGVKLNTTDIKELMQQEQSSFSDAHKKNLYEIFSFAFALHFRLGTQDYLQKTLYSSQKVGQSYDCPPKHLGD